MPARGRAGQNNAQQIDPNQNFTRENNSNSPSPKIISQKTFVSIHMYIQTTKIHNIALKNSNSDKKKRQNRSDLFKKWWRPDMPDMKSVISSQFMKG